jgi:hypothetical protein
VSHRSVLLTILLAAMAFSCGPKENEFRDGFQWISGKWSGTLDDVEVVEHWMWNKHRFEGFGYHVSEGDTVFKEYLFLEEYQGIPGFTAVYGDNGPYTFAMKHSDGQVFVFQNEDHDFPSKIIYQLDSDSALTITLIGNGNPSKEEQSYQLLRTK